MLVLYCVLKSYDNASHLNVTRSRAARCPHLVSLLTRHAVSSRQVLELLGLDHPQPSWYSDGESLVPLLAATAATRRAAYAAADAAAAADGPAARPPLRVPRADAPRAAAIGWRLGSQLAYPSPPGAMGRLEVSYPWR